jgi:hypothetical protein
MPSEAAAKAAPAALAIRPALTLAENGRPIIARLACCIDGESGRRLLACQHQLRAVLAERSLACPRLRHGPPPPSPKLDTAESLLSRSPSCDRRY